MADGEQVEPFPHSPKNLDQSVENLTKELHEHSVQNSEVSSSQFRIIRSSVHGSDRPNLPMLNQESSFEQLSL